tara:strand:- start:14477 stop:14704 length:228 start_codon:yes stop_codon:yes gene_type:complete
MGKNLSNQLFEDANRRVISKDDLLRACLRTMSEDQLYEMSIEYGFIVTDEPAERVDMNASPQERIIDAVLARHGD